MPDLIAIVSVLSAAATLAAFGRAFWHHCRLEDHQPTDRPR